MNRSSAKGPTTEPRLRECPGCGLFQTIPALPPGTKAYCARCPTILRRTSTHRLDHIVALSLTAFILLVVMGARRR
jgi:paraquat-inducible protein A